MASYNNIVILTGAGVSAESGISTFRDEGGLWASHSIEDVATPQAFQKNPGLVHRFYSARRAQLSSVKPNAAHHALARLEKEIDGTVSLVTQNVDDLHERAGSENVIHMHGSLRQTRCLACQNVHAWSGDCHIDTPCPSCLSKMLRPDIVWFGEMPYHMDYIADCLLACDLFISIGTSGTVYPAAGFVAEVRNVGRAHTLEINLEPSAGASLFRDHRYGKASEIVPLLVDEILG